MELEKCEYPVVSTLNILLHMWLQTYRYFCRIPYIIYIFFSVHLYLCLTFINTLTHTLAGAPLALSLCLREWVCVRLSKVFVFSRILFVYSFCMAFSTHTHTCSSFSSCLPLSYTALGPQHFFFAHRYDATPTPFSPGLSSSPHPLATAGN